MHELSIAEAIVAVACANAGGRQVVKVEVKVGRLRQVAPDALELAFALLAEGTAAEGAELLLEDVPVRVACRSCAAESRVDEFPLGCPRCGSLDADVVAGGELLVEALELEEAIAGVRR
jgi:hydrogenase nickel incorporation protein HypA/HybF